MNSFQIALSNVLLTLLYILPGMLLGKVKKASADHLSSMASVLLYACSPCMVINSFLQLDFSWDILKNMGLFFVVTLTLQCAFLLILYLILHKKYINAKYRILTVGAVLGNVGFFGLPIIKALFPDNPEVMCYSSTYVVSMNFLVFTMGVFCLTGDKKYMSLKSAVLNPTTIAFLIALPLFIFGVKQYLPSVLLNGVSLMGSMTTPLCMIILGIRLASVSFRKLFQRTTVYITCLLKLLIFPLFCYAAIYFLPLEFTFKASVLVLSGVPCASVLLNLAEIHHAETELAANVVLVSTLCCFLTIPVLVLLL